MPITSAPLPPFHSVLFHVSNTYGRLTMYQAKTVRALLFLSVFTAALDKARLFIIMPFLQNWGLQLREVNFSIVTQLVSSRATVPNLSL